jgi:hypothetical protein
VRRVNVNKTAIFNQTQTAWGNLRGAKIALIGVSTPVGKVGLKQLLMASRISSLLPLSLRNTKKKNLQTSNRTPVISSGNNSIQF